MIMNWTFQKLIKNIIDLESNYMQEYKFSVSFGKGKFKKFR